MSNTHEREYSSKSQLLQTIEVEISTKMQNEDFKITKSGVKHVEIGEDSAGQRLDNFLLKTLKNVPKSKIYNIIRKGEIRVNKGRSKPTYKLQIGDIVRVPPLILTEKTKSSSVGPGLEKILSSNVIYEDNKLIVINKPSGLAVHGGSGITLGLIEALRLMYPAEHYLELVHRLDRDTSGCIMIAKKRSMLRFLHEQLQSKKLDKRYLALACGRWPARKKLVDAPLCKNHLESGERIVKVNEEGKASRTEFTIIDRFKEATLVEAKPITGRTHQIRVHAQHTGHPLVGDEKYASKESLLTFRKLGAKRLFLHAWMIRFQHPDHEKKITVEAVLPDEFKKVFANLKAG